MKKNIIKILKYIPLLFLGSIGIYYNLSKTGCTSGMDIIFYIMILAPAYFIYLIILLSLSIYKTIKKKAKFDFIPIIISILCGFLIWLTAQDFMKSKILLTAIIKEVPGKANLKIRLELKPKNTCYIDFGYGEHGCTYSYNYTIKNDSLEIEESVIDQSDSVLTNRYYIDKKQQKLIPIINLQKNHLSFEIEPKPDKY